MKVKAKTDTWLLGALDAIEQRGKSAGVVVMKFCCVTDSGCPDPVSWSLCNGDRRKYA